MGCSLLCCSSSHTGSGIPKKTIFIAAQKHLGSFALTLPYDFHPSFDPDLSVIYFVPLIQIARAGCESMYGNLSRLPYIPRSCNAARIAASGSCPCRCQPRAGSGFARRTDWPPETGRPRCCKSPFRENRPAGRIARGSRPAERLIVTLTVRPVRA